MTCVDSRPSKCRRLPRRRLARPRRSTVWLAVGTLAVSAAILGFELFERLLALTAPYERHELDDLLLVAITVSIAALIHSVIRAADFKAEVRIREERERLASNLARFDPLTRLPNRRLFVDRLEQARAARRASRTALAVLLIDLDRFKPVNDLHGHAAGDEVLVELGKRFHQVGQSLSGATVARMGGDEFACLIEYPAGTDAPLIFAERALGLARLPIVTRAASVELGASIGIAVDCETVPETAELLRRADHAMYRAKSAGRNNIAMYDAEMDALARDEALLEKELRAAIGRGELVPHYQPIASLADGALSGFECLARWVHPKRGLVEAEQFIALAEKSDLIDLLSIALFRAACADARSWPAHLGLSFNLSPVQLRNSWLSEQLLRTLARFSIPPQRLTIELTESSLIADLDQAEALIRRLKDAGVSFALDDFGTGYSSLSHLRKLPFDRIKIDRSFIEGTDLRGEDRLVTAIIRMGHSLGMEVVAEGVVSESNWHALRLLGCDHAQGFLIGGALPAEGVDELLAAGAGRGRRIA